MPEICRGCGHGYHQDRCVEQIVAWDFRRARVRCWCERFEAARPEPGELEDGQ